MTDARDPAAITPDQEVTIDLLRPKDAPGVADCFRAVYGEGYPVKTYYHPEQLMAAVEKREIIEAVARTAKGEVVAVMAMYRTAPFTGIYETGAGLVLPQYRRRGLNHRLVAFLYDEVVPRYGVPLVYGESVLNHVYQQKSQFALGSIPTALEIDLMPAAAYTREHSAPGRVSALLDHRSFIPRPHPVHLPRVYDAWLREIYAWTRLERTLQTVDPVLPPSGDTVMTGQVFDFAQVARVAVGTIGADFKARAEDLRQDLTAAGVVITQFWLSLGSPHVGGAVEELRARGFYFGGLLPRWFDDDGLLMQSTPRPIDWDSIQIYSDQGQRLGEMVRADQE
jgi:GNAT superfamily N-acetyltransferase